MESSTQAPHQSPSNQQNYTSEAAVVESSPVSVLGNNDGDVTLENIKVVQNLIERCLQLYMNRDETAITLSELAKIEPIFTNLVWQKLEEGNVDFFEDYHMKLVMRKQINEFNQLVLLQDYPTKQPTQQNDLFFPSQSAIQNMPKNNSPMGTTFQLQLPIPATGWPQIENVDNKFIHTVEENRILSPGNFQPTQIDSGKEMLMDKSEADAAPDLVSVASAGQSSFTPTQTSELNAGQISSRYVTNPDTFQLEPHCGTGVSVQSPQPVSEIPRIFSLSDLLLPEFDSTDWPVMDCWAYTAPAPGHRNRRP